MHIVQQEDISRADLICLCYEAAGCLNMGIIKDNSEHKTMLTGNNNIQLNATTSESTFVVLPFGT